MQSARPNQFLALYGSLRRGQAPHETLGLETLLRFAGPCRLAGVLHDFGDWPGMVAGDGLVVAELYEVVAGDALARLDDFEECDRARPGCGLFVRRLVPLAEPAGLCAFVYFYNHDPARAPVVAAGDWLEHLRAKAGA